MVLSPVPAVDRQPKSIRLHNGAGDVPNTPPGKRNRKPPSFIVAGTSKPSTSPLKTPSPLCKRMALLDHTHDFIGDCVCQLVGTLQWYGNVTHSRMEDKKTKLWTVKYDNDAEEELTLHKLILLKKRYEQQKQYDTEVNKKLPAMTAAPTLPWSKKKKESTVAKKKTTKSSSTQTIGSR